MLVGIDSLNIDDTADPARPVHSTLLRSDIPIVEHLTGLDRLPDGSPVAYTFYRGDSGTILCTYMKSHGLQPPPGEAVDLGETNVYGGEHHYYQYKGYSVCLSYPRTGCICILVSQHPMKQFVQDVVTSTP